MRESKEIVEITICISGFIRYLNEEKGVNLSVKPHNFGRKKVMVVVGTDCHQEDIRFAEEEQLLSKGLGSVQKHSIICRREKKVRICHMVFRETSRNLFLFFRKRKIYFKRTFSSVWRHVIIHHYLRFLLYLLLHVL